VASFCAFGAAFAAGTPDGRLAARCLAALALARLLEPTDASAAVLALVCAGCRLAGSLPAPRARAARAGLALALVAVRTAVFHASGNAETLSTVDVGPGFLPVALGGPPAPGTGVSADVIGAVALLSLRFACPWIALFAAASRAFEAARDERGTRVLLGDLAVAYGARGAAVVAALAVWWRSGWWLPAGTAVFLFAAAEVCLASLAFGLTASRTTVARGAGASRPLEAPAPVAAARA
jgi:hypothetical protein